MATSFTSLNHLSSILLRNKKSKSESLVMTVSLHILLEGNLAVSEVVEPTRPSMVDLEIQKKVDAIALTEKLQNVAEAARISGVSRQTLYKDRRLLNSKQITRLN
ncbi:hypothetical protein C8R11_106153 [Nitrosomonas aestuarii]|nr:hypothetical protein C8R11_106153 [Nitrosomonas aestuarii]